MQLRFRSGPTVALYRVPNALPGRSSFLGSVLLSIGCHSLYVTRFVDTTFFGTYIIIRLISGQVCHASSLCEEDDDSIPQHAGDVVSCICSRPKTDMVQNLSKKLQYIINHRHTCCGCMNLKTAAFLIGLVDSFFWSAAVARGIYLYLHISRNPLATNWLIVSLPLLVVSCFAILLMLYGIWKEKYLWILPQIVVKITTILISTALAALFTYLLITQPQMAVHLTAPILAEVDSTSLKNAIKVGGSVFMLGSIVFILFQMWFTVTLITCYKVYRVLYLIRCLQDQNVLCRNINLSMLAG
ncbi:unnamed protein product [Soboliphyme baturini]|uniref:Uncharacterized protein n=1 Tax=Soboliphyme baturini TaxID=241478 RepID=A0A183IQ90_9BILA|nr:unnamed protein product [Soboliphyme baturini]